MSHEWKLKLERGAMKQFNKLSREDKDHVYKGLETLLRSENPPLLPDVTKIKRKRKSLENFYRLRCARLRVEFILDAEPDETFRGTVIVRDVSRRGDNNLYWWRV